MYEFEEDIFLISLDFQMRLLCPYKHTVTDLYVKTALSILCDPLVHRMIVVSGEDMLSLVATM